MGTGDGDGEGDGEGEGEGDGDGDGEGGSVISTTSTKFLSPQSKFLLIITNPWSPQSTPQEFLTIQSPLEVYPTKRTA